MAFVTYSLDEQQIQEIEDALMRAPRQMEWAINNTIHVKGAKLIMQSIIDFIPIGERDQVNGRRKKHAKTSWPLTQENFNLGVTIYAKTAYDYLTYPDMGIGKRNTAQQDFFAEGLQGSGDTIFQWIIEAIDENLGGLK